MYVEELAGPELVYSL